MRGTKQGTESEGAFAYPRPLAAGPLPGAWDSLFVGSGLFRPRRGGGLYYRGERPGPEWHAHGTTPQWMAMLHDGRLQRLEVHKQRWKHRESDSTVHSRPPDSVAFLHCCTLVVLLKLWAWISQDEGLLHYREVVPDLERFGAARTVQRWLRRALPLARQTQHAIRAEILDRSEPRPLESWFPRGVPPPGDTIRARWRDPATVAILTRAFAFALVGAVRLRVPVARLLAGARGRWWTGPSDHFVI